MRAVSAAVFMGRNPAAPALPVSRCCLTSASFEPSCSGPTHLSSTSPTVTRSQGRSVLDKRLNTGAGLVPPDTMKLALPESSIAAASTPLAMRAAKSAASSRVAWARNSYFMALLPFEPCTSVTVHHHGRRKRPITTGRVKFRRSAAPVPSLDQAIDPCPGRFDFVAAHEE